MKAPNRDRILLAHGGGGRLSDELIRQHILPSLGNDILAELADAANLNLTSNSVCFTTDSYVVKPLQFVLLRTAMSSSRCSLTAAISESLPFVGP
jgi:hydrogenase maturation factor